MLDQSNYIATLDENLPVGSVVLRFTVSDNDQFGPASELGVATILGVDVAFFTVAKTGRNSGEIRSK